MYFDIIMIWTDKW